MAAGKISPTAREEKRENVGFEIRLNLFTAQTKR